MVYIYNVMVRNSVGKKTKNNKKKTKDKKKKKRIRKPVNTRGYVMLSRMYI